MKHTSATCKRCIYATTQASLFVLVNTCAMEWSTIPRAESPSGRCASSCGRKLASSIYEHLEKAERSHNRIRTLLPSIVQNDGRGADRRVQPPSSGGGAGV